MISIWLLHLAALASPGANVLLVSQMAASGRRDSARFAGLGVVVGAGLWAVSAVLGVHAVFQAFPVLRLSLQVVGGQEPPQLLEGDEFRIVHIDHHAVMIDPRTSLQAHTPLETRTALQAHTPLEEAASGFSRLSAQSSAGRGMTDFFLQSARVGFRLWRTSDLPLAFALWGDPAVTRFIAAGGLSERQIQARLEREIETELRHGIQYWPIFITATGEHIGSCGLRPHGDDPDITELGVHIASRHWRQGYAFEAASRAIEHAFGVVAAKALFAGHNPANIASRSLLMRLGFVYTHDELYEPTGLRHPSYILVPSQVRPDSALNQTNREAAATPHAAPRPVR